MPKQNSAHTSAVGARHWAGPPSYNHISERRSEGARGADPFLGSTPQAHDRPWADCDVPAKNIPKGGRGAESENAKNPSSANKGAIPLKRPWLVPRGSRYPALLVKQKPSAAGTGDRKRPGRVRLAWGPPVAAWLPRIREDTPRQNTGHPRDSLEASDGILPQRGAPLPIRSNEKSGHP